MSEEFYGTGKRKTSVARVFLKKGTGRITINGEQFETYFGDKVLQTIVMQPIVHLEFQGRFDINATIAGGGSSGQAGAMRLGITRALINYNQDLKPSLRAEGL